MIFKWKFNDYIFSEEMLIDDMFDDEYYGVGELICDVFLITELRSIHQNDGYLKDHPNIIHRLYFSNKLAISTILNFKKEINEIQINLNNIKDLNNERDLKLEAYLIDYISRTKYIISNRLNAINDDECVTNIKNYVNENKRYTKLSSHINKLEENLHNYINTEDYKLAIKLSKTILNQVNKIPEIMGQIYSNSKQFYKYLFKNLKKYGDIDLDINKECKFDHFLGDLQDAAYILIDIMKTIIENLQSAVCNKRIYSESYFQSSVDTLKKYINISDIEDLRDYKDDGSRCFSIMETYFKNGSNQLVFTLSGVWDSQDVDIEKFFSKSGGNSNLINACYQLKTILNAKWAVTTRNVQNYMVDIHGDMQCIGNLGNKMSLYPKGYIEEKKELRKVVRDFTCCERKIVSYINNNFKSDIIKCNLYVKFQPCEKCLYALNEFKKRIQINKKDFYLVHARTDELD